MKLQTFITKKNRKRLWRFKVSELRKKLTSMPNSELSFLLVSSCMKKNIYLERERFFGIQIDTSVPQADWYLFSAILRCPAL